MRNMIGLLVVAAVLSAAGCSGARAGVSLSVSVGHTAVCEPCDDCGYYSDPCMHREDLIVINNDLVGFWIRLPTGRWVFRCRSMWYDGGLDEWHYSAWWDNFFVSYSCHCRDAFHGYCPFHGARFGFYMQRHYPRYWERHYRHHPGPRGHKMEKHSVYGDGRERAGSGTVRRAAPVNHPITIVEKVKPVDPGQNRPADRSMGARIDRSDNRGPAVSGRGEIRAKSVPAERRSGSGATVNRTGLRRELGRR